MVSTEHQRDVQEQHIRPLPERGRCSAPAVPECKRVALHIVSLRCPPMHLWAARNLRNGALLKKIGFLEKEF
jgi:hypothetical protein